MGLVTDRSRHRNDRLLNRILLHLASLPSGSRVGSHDLENSLGRTDWRRTAEGTQKESVSTETILIGDSLLNNKTNKLN